MDRSLFLICILIFVTRLPFLSDGFGHEEDSWGLALNAISMHSSGEYEASRLPGHPLQEWIYAAIGANPSAFLFNLFSAFFGALGAWFFGGMVSTLGLPRPWLAALLLGMVPVYFAASSYTIDYVWAASFALGSGFFLLKKKYWLAGIFLGLATACRITSGAWLLCFLPLIGFRFHRTDILNMIKVLAGTLILSILFYFPVVQRYGPGFFMYYDQFPYPNIAKLIYKMSLGVWGALGMLAIAIFLLPAILKQHWNKNILIAFIIATILFSIAYLRLPQKSGYMIPLIPFVLLFFLERLQGKKLLIFSGMIVLSPWIMGFNLTDGIRGADHSAMAIKFQSSGQEIFFDPIQGPIWNEKSKRINKSEYTDRVVNALDSMVVSKLICGWWYNELAVKMHRSVKRSSLAFYLSEEEMKSTPMTIDINTDLHGKIYYLPEQDKYNDLYSGIQSTRNYAEPFPVK